MKKDASENLPLQSSKVSLFDKVSTCLENLENLGILGSLTAVEEMSGQAISHKLGKCRGSVQEKSCYGKLFIANFTLPCV